MSRSIFPRCATAAAVSLLASSAGAQEAENLLNQAAGYTIRLEPMVWYASPSGEIKSMPGGSGASDSIRLERLNLDTPRVSPSGEVTFRADRFSLRFGGAAYSVEQENFASDRSFTLGSVTAAEGEALSTSFDFAMFEVSAGWCVYERDFREESSEPLAGLDASLAVDLIAGLRAYEFDISIERPGVSRTSVDERFIEPIVGARAEFEILRDFTIDLGLNAGYFAESERDSFSFDLIVGFTWRPVEHVGVQIGWRQLAYSLEDGEDDDRFEYDGRMAGLYAGITVRF